MRVAVVGLGFMGATHLLAYQKAGLAEIAAVVSGDPKKLSGDLSAIGGNLEFTSLATETIDFGQIARYAKAEEAFADPTIDAVDLCVPTYLHAPLAQAALGAGKHVLVEKPMALTGDECDAMISAAHKNGRVLMVAQVIRYWPEYRAAREIIRSGKLGAVRAASLSRKCAVPSWSKWMHDPANSGGGVFDLLIHDFDYCLQLFGRPQSISAVGVEAIDKGIDVSEARLHYENNMPVTISGGWQPSDYPFSMAFSIACDDGVLDFHSASRPLSLYRADRGPDTLELPPTDGFEAELQAFVDACERGEAPADCRPEESALATRMTLAMRASREMCGGPVAV